MFPIKINIYKKKVEHFKCINVIHFQKELKYYENNDYIIIVFKSLKRHCADTSYWQTFQLFMAIKF